MRTVRLDGVLYEVIPPSTVQPGDRLSGAPGVVVEVLSTKATPHPWHPIYVTILFDRGDPWSTNDHYTVWREVVEEPAEPVTQG